MEKNVNESCVRIFKLKAHSVESETTSELCFSRVFNLWIAKVIIINNDIVS